MPVAMTIAHNNQLIALAHHHQLIAPIAKLDIID
jgi:hypothetical protein